MKRLRLFTSRIHSSSSLRLRFRARVRRALARLSFASLYINVCVRNARCELGRHQQIAAVLLAKKDRFISIKCYVYRRLGIDRASCVSAQASVEKHQQQQRSNVSSLSLSHAHTHDTKNTIKRPTFISVHIYRVHIPWCIDIAHNDDDASAGIGGSRRSIPSRSVSARLRISTIMAARDDRVARVSCTGYSVNCYENHPINE